MLASVACQFSEALGDGDIDSIGEGGEPIDGGRLGELREQEGAGAPVEQPQNLCAGGVGDFMQDGEGIVTEGGL